MMEKDKRVKADIFPISVFAITFAVFGLLTTLQFRILGNYIDISDLEFRHTIMILVLWFVVADSFTIITSYQIRKCYQKPIEDLADLIQNMLKLNKLEKQVIRPQMEYFDVTAQICECALQFEEQWEQKEIMFEVDVEERVMIEADAGLLELVWTNLFSNALKFTPQGGTIILSTIF